MSWQPIETAPRDGTPVLVWQPSDHGGLTRVCSNEGANWLSWPGPFEYRPTHWMPLPEPPND